MDRAANAMRAAIVVVSLLLVWRVIHVNAVSFDDTGRPRLPAMPAASDVVPGERNGVERARLRRILAGSPGEVAALLMLATELESDGDLPKAASAYLSALNLAPLDRQALTLAAAHFLGNDDPRGVELLARLVTHHPGARQHAFPLLREVLVTGRHPAAWSEVVSRNPSWMGAFIADACAGGVDPMVLAPLLLQRSASGTATHAEAACAIDRFRQSDRWEQAHQLWLNMLARERLSNVGFVFNGSFEFDPTGVGFDWVLQRAPEKQSGHVAEVLRVRGAAGERALRVAYNGKRQSGAPAKQFLALPAGDYELSGLVRVESIKALRGIHWTVRCVEKATPLEVVASSERFLGSGEWRRFAMSFAVGGSCLGQVLQLEPVALDGAVSFVTGVAWFDDLAIRQR